MNSKKVKITYIVSDIDKALAFEWVAECLDKEQFDLNFVLLNPGPSHLESFLREEGIACTFIKLHKGWRMGLSFLNLLAHLLRNRPDIVHCHLRYATLLGITAAWLAGIRRRIYTRHSSDYNARYHPHAVKYDRLINRLSTGIVAISDVVRNTLLREGAKAGKITKIPHGFDLELFENPERQDELRAKYNPTERGPVVGVIGRYVQLKGHEYIITAFSQLLERHSNALLVLANAHGPAAAEIKKALNKLPPGSYVEVRFEKNLPALYSIFDVYVHVPINNTIEAFGQTYVEALAAGVPSVFTLSGIAGEFIRDGENALVVDYQDSAGIFQKMITLLEDSHLAERLKINGRRSVAPFALQQHIAALQQFYTS